MATDPKLTPGSLPGAGPTTPQIPRPRPFEQGNPYDGAAQKLVRQGEANGAPKIDWSKSADPSGPMPELFRTSSEGADKQ